MRISGIASGFDTEEMVRQLMQVERVKVNKVEQNRQTMMWRQEQYNSINKQFANFILNTQKEIGLKKTSSTGITLPGSYKDLDYIKKGTSSNEDVATVTSTSKAANGNFEIKVGKVPQNASFTSAKITNESLIGADGERLKEMKFEIDGHEVTVGDGEKDITVNDVVKAINDAKVRTYKGQEIKDGQVTIDGEVIEIDKLDETEKKKIKETPLGISAFYDSGTGRMFLESSEGGSEIKITGDNNLITGKGGSIKPNDKGEIGIANDDQSISQEGNKGQVTVNGLAVIVKNGKVEFNGLIIDIKAEGTTRIEVNTNTDGILEKIEKLVEDYNNLVDLASGLVNEKIHSSYHPLSPEERKELSPEDLKLWDEKAKSGLLNKDETIQRVLQNIRTDLYKTLEGKDGSFKHITEIGISTEKYSRGSAGGKLQIDTEKLKKAISEDAEGVMELLFKDGKEESKDTNKTSTQGVFTRVYDDLIDGMKAIIEKSGPGEDADLYRSVQSNMLLKFVTEKGSISDLQKSVNEMNRQIDNLNMLLAKKEDAHYAKFTAMEKAMHKMNGQSQWLQQQFMF